MSSNPNAMHLLEQNKEKINCYSISINPRIFTYDYVAMKENHRDLKEELIQLAWHPSRITAWLDAGVDLEDM